MSKLGLMKASVAALMTCSILVVVQIGVQSVASAAPVTTAITLYPQGSGVYPDNISGSPSGDLWFSAGVSGTVDGQPANFIEAGRLTTAGAGDGTAVLSGLAAGTPPVVLASRRPIVAGPNGSAYLSNDLGSDGPRMVDSSLNVTTAPGPEGTFGVTWQGGNVYFGHDVLCSSVGCGTSGQLLSGFPPVNQLAATPSSISALAADYSSVDLIEYPHTYAYWSGYTGLTTCNGIDSTFPADSRIFGMSAGNAGLWFTDYARHSVWHYTGSCQAKEFAVPDGSTPHSIADGPDGNAYFTTTSGIWEVNTNGYFVQYTNPGLVDPESITAGSDGNMWFTDSMGHQIGKLSIPHALTVYDRLVLFNPIRIGTSSTGTIPVNAPGGITRLSSSSPDFTVGTGSDPGGPLNLAADCPPSCQVAVTFAPPPGTRPGLKVGVLTVVGPSGEPQYFLLVGLLRPALPMSVP